MDKKPNSMSSEQLACLEGDGRFFNDEGPKQFWAETALRPLTWLPKAMENFLFSEYASVYIVFQSLCIRWIETLMVRREWLATAAEFGNLSQKWAVEPQQQFTRVILSSVGAPLFFYYYRLPDGSNIRYNQSWSMLSFLLVLPLTQSMSAAFARRERAIQFLQQFKSNAVALFLAHRDWDWFTIPKDAREPAVSGRCDRLQPDHVQRVLSCLSCLCHLLNLVLMSPSSHVMHTIHPEHQYVEEIEQTARDIRRRIQKVFNDMSLLGEEFKEAGLPASEATRIRQFFQVMNGAYNEMVAIKSYHTPLGLRALTRLWVLALPWLFGAYWGAMSTGGAGVTFTCFFSVVQSLALKSLFVLRFGLEDPFVSISSLPKRVKDAIDITGELIELREDLEMLFKMKGEKREAAAGEVRVGEVKITVTQRR